jgi:hypothetical protein
VKIALTVNWTALAVLCLCGSSASAGAVDRFFCARVSGGPISSFAMTIDYDAKRVELPDGADLRVDPDTVKVAGDRIEWSFMRGFAMFDRHSGVLDWDTTSEYAYLAAVDSFSHAPESDYKGRMRCRAVTPH